MPWDKILYVALAVLLALVVVSTVAGARQHAINREKCAQQGGVYHAARDSHICVRPDAMIPLK